MEGDPQAAQQGAGGGGTYEKEWAEYYAKWGYPAGYGQQTATGDTAQYAQQWQAYQQQQQPYGQAAYGGYGGYAQARGGGGVGGHAQNFGGSGGQQPSPTVWVGHLAPTVGEQDLNQAFGAFIGLRDVKLIRDKNCAFVRYGTIEEATAAYNGMTGQFMHGQQLKIGWGKPEPERAGPSAIEARLPEMPPARNLWIGNIDFNVTEEDIRARFAPFGAIDRVSVLREKNCAFVNFVSLESALEARKSLQGALLGTRNLRINFGKQTDADRSALSSVPGLGGDGYHSRSPARSMEPALIQPPAPSDPAMKATIDKLAAHVVKTGPAFEETIKEKQGANPAFSFLFEGDANYDYYKWKLFDERQKKNQAEGGGAAPTQVNPWAQPQQTAPAPSPWAQQQSSAPVSTPWSQPQQYPAQSSYRGPSSSSGPPAGGRPLAPSPTGQPLSDADKSALSTMLDTLVPTKDSIKNGKDWIMARPDQASSIAAFICNHLEQTPEFTSKLNMIYLANDVLHHSMKNRNPGAVGDTFCDAFKPYLIVMLWSAHHGQESDNQQKVLKMLHIWRTKGIYNAATIAQMESMIMSSGGGGSGPTGGAPRGRGGLGYVPTADDRAQQSARPPPPGGAYGSFNSVPPPQASMLSGIDDLISRGRSAAHTDDTRKRQRSPSPDRRSERPRHH